MERSELRRAYRACKVDCYLPVGPDPCNMSRWRRGGSRPFHALPVAAIGFYCSRIKRKTAGKFECDQTHAGIAARCQPQQ